MTVSRETEEDLWCPGCGSSDFDPHFPHEDDCGGIEDPSCVCSFKFCPACCPECNPLAKETE